MVLGWFERDNFQRTAKEVVILALQERRIAFYELNPVVQTTLLGEAIQNGCQRSLGTFTSTKAAIESTHTTQKLREALLLEIYRERGKMLLKHEDAHA